MSFWYRRAAGNYTCDVSIPTPAALGRERLGDMKIWGSNGEVVHLIFDFYNVWSGTLQAKEVNGFTATFCRAPRDSDCLTVQLQDPNKEHHAFTIALTWYCTTSG